MNLKFSPHLQYTVRGLANTVNNDVFIPSIVKVSATLIVSAPSIVVVRTGRKENDCMCASTTTSKQDAEGLLDIGPEYKCNK